MSDPVPAIAEANATGENAEIFADIRRVLGVDVVNLIWRHLATIPGALPRAWGSLRPLYVDGTIGAEAAALHGDLDFPRLPPFPREVSLQRVFLMTTSERSAIFSPPMTGPTRWRSSPCPRCCCVWRISRSASRHHRAAPARRVNRCL
jgi:hypothetical protein